MVDSKQPKLHGDHFYKFFQCPHWIWYDIYGDFTKKRSMPPLLDLIYQGKALDVHNSIGKHKKFEEIKPELYKDIEEAFLATLELMRQGKNIYHGVLMNDNWVGIPDLLEARPGKSNFGDFHYVVYDIQNSLGLKDENKFQLIFYSLILERLQGIRPEKAYVIDADGNEQSFAVDEFVNEFHYTREQIEKILNGEKPAPFLKSGCKRTPWYSLCLEETKGCNDVSLIFKLSQADQRRLYEIGIMTVSDLAGADVNDLQSKLEDWPFDKIIRINNQAKVLINGESMILKRGYFPSVKTEVYFDVEGDPTSDTDYLLGYLVKKDGKTEYNYLMAKDKSGESEIWKNFLDFLAELDDFVIYHYAYYERQVFDRLALKYGAPTSLVNKFRDNTIDLHAKLVDSAVLPLYFYSLKDVAGYLGYKWSDPSAGGAESVVWYSEWLKTKNLPDRQAGNKILKKLLQYNEDDVRATLLIKEWLEKQKPHISREKLD